MIAVFCSECGSKTMRFPRDFKRHRPEGFFCTPRCQHDFRSKNRMGQLGYNYIDGRSTKIKKEKPTIAEIIKSKSVSGNGGCINWIGYKIKSGYGRITISRTQHLAHRLSWQINIGPIPNGIDVLHKCDNPSCVNHKHLFLGTHKENMKDMKEKNRSCAGEKHPKRKLSNKQVLQIRDMYKTGNLTHLDISKKFGIARSGVSRIINKKLWRHI